MSTSGVTESTKTQWRSGCVFAKRLNVIHECMTVDDSGHKSVFVTSETQCNEEFSVVLACNPRGRYGSLTVCNVAVLTSLVSVVFGASL